MTLPGMTAGQSFNSGAGSFQGRASGQGGARVEMAIDFGCLLSCGAKALGCITCGTSIPCWIACAGPEVVSCATKCF